MKAVRRLNERKNKSNKAHPTNRLQHPKYPKWLVFASAGGLREERLKRSNDSEYEAGELKGFHRGVLYCHTFDEVLLEAVDIGRMHPSHLCDFEIVLDREDLAQIDPGYRVDLLLNILDNDT